MPIPLYPDLTLLKRPWATLAIIVLCFSLHFIHGINYQDNRKLVYSITLQEYPALEDSIPHWAFINLDGTNPEIPSLFDQVQELAFYYLEYPYLERQIRDEWFDFEEEFQGSVYNTPEIRASQDYRTWSDEDEQAFKKAFLETTSRIRDRLKWEGSFSVHQAFMAHQNYFNPWRWITTSLIHGDWGHFIFNMLFFFAFGALVEIIINSTRRYLMLLLMIALTTGLADYLLHLNTDGLHTLGFSGVVTGVIGMAAFLAPRARIRTFELFSFFYGRNFSIPAWVLAVFFIGGDMYSMATSDVDYGVNLFAHVAGGISGYFLAFFLLRDRKEDVAEELEDAIEYRRAQRADRLGVMSSATTGQRRVLGEEIVRTAQHEYDLRIDRLYALTQNRKYDLATVELVDIVDEYAPTMDTLLDLFKRIEQWSPSVVSLHMARLVINRAIATRQLSLAVETAKWAVSLSKAFVLADPDNLPLLAETAMSLEEYELTHILTQDYTKRYAGYGDVVAIDRIRDRLNQIDFS